MPQTFKQLFAETCRTVQRNTYARILSHVTGTKLTQEPAIADNDESSESATILATLYNLKSEAFYAAVLMTSGVILTLIPKKALTIPTISVQLNDPANPDAAPEIITDLASDNVHFVNREGGGLTRITIESETRNCDTGEIDQTNSTDEKSISRPRAPGLDKSPPTMDVDRRKVPTFFTKTSTTVGGLKLVTAGVETAFYGAYAGVTSAASGLLKGAQKLSNLVSRGTPKP